MEITQHYYLLVFYLFARNKTTTKRRIVYDCFIEMEELTSSAILLLMISKTRAFSVESREACCVCEHKFYCSRERLISILIITAGPN